jgi:uncharacterized coiled-coil protein SlyX
MSKQDLRAKIEAIPQASVSFPLLKLLGRVESLEIMVKSQDQAIQNLMDTIADLTEGQQVLKDFTEDRKQEAEMEQHMLDTVEGYAPGEKGYEPYPENDQNKSDEELDVEE